MKNKIRNAIVIIFAGILMSGIQSCEKYPDGPTISLVSRAERVANTWKVENYKVNTIDYTSLVAGYTEKFTKAGDYSYNWGIISGTGTWAFQNNDKEIKITGSNDATHTLIILKLEEKQFWYYYMDGSDKKEFHMIQQ